MSATKLWNPIQSFLKIESFSGFLLFGTTVLALLLANSPLSETYQNFWQQQVGFQWGDFELVKPLILWVNDGLMAIFFFVIGLEIKRELVIGELNTFKKASFPLLAALGGMFVPMVVYMLMNQNPETFSGWGIPMATDIAFSLAILNLLGNRVPLGLKIFLTAFAIVDDLGAVIVIAVFYSGALQTTLLIVAAILLLALYVLSYFRWYSKYVYFLVGLLVWFLFLKSGIHPTIAGVLLAFSIPISRKVDEQIFTRELSKINHNFEQLADDKPTTLSKEQIDCIDELEYWTEQIQSPLQHLEHKLHNWVAYVIMPIFALANAGVIFADFATLESPLILQIIVALVLGKLVGIVLLSYIGLKLKWIALPEQVNFSQVIGVALLAGVGFTMSIFVANLAFSDLVYIESAKMGILLASLLAGILGYVILAWQSKK